MSNPFFHFKQFSIRQDKCAMKVGTDGVLLGAWVDVPFSTRWALDVGTGSGLIALMIAQRCNGQAMIEAIDVDVDACNQAFENVAESPYKDRISVVRQSFFDYSPEKKYDLIVSNPPFFKNALPCPDEKRNTARHDDSLPLKRLIEHAVSMLSENGRIALILPALLSDELDFIIATHRLFIRRRTEIITVEGNKPKRFLVEITANNVQNPIPEHQTLILETKDHQRTAEYKKLLTIFVPENFIE